MMSVRQRTHCCCQTACRPPLDLRAKTPSDAVTRRRCMLVSRSMQVPRHRYVGEYGWTLSVWTGSAHRRRERSFCENIGSPSRATMRARRRNTCQPAAWAGNSARHGVLHEVGKQSWSYKNLDVLHPAHNPYDESDEDNCSEDAADIHTNLR
jgi:hypothetical protein